MTHNKPKQIIDLDNWARIPIYSTGTISKQNKKIAQHLKRKHKKKKFTIYWAETLREKMQRWVDSDISPVRLAELGVPCNMMTPVQYGTMMHHYLAQENKI